MDAQEILKKVLRIEIRTRRLVNSILSGEYHSAFRGQGMEFAEVRDYQPGDDVRTIDWNVTARMGHPFVKVFHEERELSVMLMVDASSSGEFGTVERMKHEIAVEICALLAFSAIRNNDQVGLIIFTDEIETFIPPKKGRRHVLRVIRELLWHYDQTDDRTNKKATAHKTDGTDEGKETSESGTRGLRLSAVTAVVGALATSVGGWLFGLQTASLIAALTIISTIMVFAADDRSRHQGRGTDIRGALDYLNRVARRRGIVFLISDFLEDASQYEQVLRIANRRHDLIAITVTDPAEVDIPKVGLIDLEDAETGERILLDTGSRRVREQVFEYQDERRLTRQRLFQRTGVDSIDVFTNDEPQDQPYVRPLMRFFEARANRV